MKKKLNRGYEVRIYPNDDQIEMFEKTFGCVRLIWNYSLMEKEYVYQMYKDYPELLHSHSFKTPAKWKTDFPFLKEVDSQALATTQQELLQSLNNFFRKSHKKPKYKSKKNNRVSYTTHTTNNNIRIEDECIKLPKVGYVKLKKQRKKLPDDYIIKAATIKRTPTGKYFVSLRLEYEQEVKQRTNRFVSTVGLDFSTTDFYIDSEGKKVNYPTFYQKSEEKIIMLDKKMKRQVYGSNGYLKTKHKRAKLFEKISNQRKDFHHKLSRKLVNEYDIIGVETLDLQEMTKNKYRSKKVNDTGYHQFLNFLSYKCEDEGVFLNKANKYYASSKTCSACGIKKKTLPLSQREYSCECGNVINRDFNAAINLAVQGMKSYLISTIEDRTTSIAW
jgi:putative transposase